MFTVIGNGNAQPSENDYLVTVDLPENPMELIAGSFQIKVTLYKDPLVFVSELETFAFFVGQEFEIELPEITGGSGNDEDNVTDIKESEDNLKED